MVLMYVQAQFYECVEDRAGFPPLRLGLLAPLR